MNDGRGRQVSTERRRSDVRRGRHSERYRREVDAETVMRAFATGPFRVVPYARLVERAGLPIPLGSRAFDLLCLLAGRPGQVVSKSELIARTWPDVTVEESTLRFHIAKLRRALGDSQANGRYIVNVPGRGYCFVARVTREAVLVEQSRERSQTDSDLSLPAARPLATV